MSLHSSTTFRAREAMSVFALRLFSRMLQQSQTGLFSVLRYSCPEPFDLSLHSQGFVEAEIIQIPPMSVPWLMQVM